VLFSFHGLPERQIKKADNHDYCLKENCCSSHNEKNYFCYRAQCFSTARLLAEELNISEEKYTICFQSRLGKDPWIKPYSDDVIRQRAEAGDKKLLVFAPAFVSDCLETLYEIRVEYDELFKEHGGEKAELVESLNDSPRWIKAMEQIILK
jgi:ferrochelatase